MKLKKYLTALVRSNHTKGFTLIELLVVIGIIAILTAVVAIAVNPGRQFQAARDTERRSEIRELLSAVYQYSARNNGNLPPTLIGVTTPTNIGTGVGLVDLGADLVPDYLAVVPVDPLTGCDDADTCYVIFRDGNRVTASASGELDPVITLSQ